MSFLKTPGVQSALIYFFAAIILFLLLATASRFLSALDTRLHLLLFMAAAVLLGLVNAWLLDKKLYAGFPDWLKAGLGLAANLLGAVIFIFFSSGSLTDFHLPLFIPALMLFSLPWFFGAALRAILAIPALEYQPLCIGGLKDIVAEINWAEDESRGIVWQFENLEEMAAGGQYWIRTHTPYRVEDMTLKDLFKGLLSLHNHNLNPGQPIHFREGSQLHGWRFYCQRGWLFRARPKPLDPERTLARNGIRFRLLPRNEREEMKNLRKGLHKNFRTVKIMAVRINNL